MNILGPMLAGATLGSGIVLLLFAAGAITNKSDTKAMVNEFIQACDVPVKATITVGTWSNSATFQCDAPRVKK